MINSESKKCSLVIVVTEKYQQPLLIKQEHFFIVEKNYHAFQAQEDQAYRIFGRHSNKEAETIILQLP